MSNIKVLSLFSGIGAFEEALKNIGIQFEVINYCEIEDKIAKAYSLIHKINESKRIKDIRGIRTEEIENCDLITLGFPCVDISSIGKQQGIIEGETRSGLLYNALDIIKVKLPSYIVIENAGNWKKYKKFIYNYEEIMETLDDFGYSCYGEILNSLDYGHAQHRERTYVVAIRKDKNKDFKFPEKNIKNTKKLDSIIEIGQADSTYYLTEKNIKSYVLKRSEFKKRFNVKNIYTNHASTLCAKGCKEVITNNYIVDIKGIRGLTERECFKLQGFNPDYVKLLNDNKIQGGVVYKMIGNSIPVKVLEGIFRNLFDKEFIV